MAPLARIGRPTYYRRDFVASAAVSVASCILGVLPARAQGEYDEAVAAVDANLKDAAELLQDVLHKIEPSFDDKTADEITQIHYELRVNLASILYDLPQPAQIMLVDPRYAQIALIISSYEGVPLVPAPNEISRIDINMLSASAETYACDRYRAIFFIILDAIGLKDEDKDLVVEAIRDTPIQVKLEQLVDGYPNRTWDETAKQIVDLLLVMGGLEFGGRLYKVLGNRAVKAMSRKMSLYLVPYAGWVYGTIVICASLKKNWELLVC